jgi:four helix bundle protein
MNAAELQNRLKQFAYRVVPLCESLPAKKINKIVEDQLLRSAFSAAANYRAACKGQSAKAFISKLNIAFEEIDESLFWLEVISDLKIIDNKKFTLILKEADELARILASSRKTSQNKAIK